MNDTILSDEDLLRALKYGIWTKVTFDDGEVEDEFTHYAVVDFSEDELLICYQGINWTSGELYYTPHIIKQKYKDKTWFLDEPLEEEIKE